MIHVIDVAWVRGILLMHHATFASLARSACAFAEVKERFYKPAEGYTPIIVVHSSFAWDSKFPIILHALLKVPYAPPPPIPAVLSSLHIISQHPSRSVYYNAVV